MIDSDESGEEPQELPWYTGDTKKRKSKGKQNAAKRATGPILPVVEQEEPMAEVYAGDPTEQEVIDNVRNLPDISRPGGKVMCNHLERELYSLYCSLKTIF